MFRAFNTNINMVITSLKKSAVEIKEKLTPLLGKDVTARVRTMAPLLVNSLASTFKAQHLIIDEALTSHFDVVMSTHVAGANHGTLMRATSRYPSETRSICSPYRTITLHPWRRSLDSSCVLTGTP